jgi:glycosyltransferase involved in cell wall biosynthesis
MPDATQSVELSIVLPCLNEERTVGQCVKHALSFLDASHVAGEVIVADNGSTDCSREVAACSGARVISVQQ